MSYFLFYYMVCYVWQLYNRVISRQHFKMVKKVFVPKTGVTIEWRKNLSLSKSKSKSGSSVVGGQKN